MKRAEEISGVLVFLFAVLTGLSMLTRSENMFAWGGLLIMSYFGNLLVQYFKYRK